LARVFGVPGSEKELIEQLHSQGIHSFRSLDEIEIHLKNKDSAIQDRRKLEAERILMEIKQLRQEHKDLRTMIRKRKAERTILLKEEKKMLERKLSVSPIPTRNPLLIIYRKFIAWKDRRRLSILEEHFSKEVKRPFKRMEGDLLALGQHIQYLVNNEEEEIQKRLAPQLDDMKRIDRALSNAGNWLSGARGEGKVVDELSRLPDSYIVVNDVCLQLKPPMQTSEGRRFSCQIDHVVIGPSGVYSVETKNWNPKSINNPDLKSPVEQARFSGKALWRQLKQAVNMGHIAVQGKGGLSVTNVLAMTGTMLPDTPHQYVHVLPANGLRALIQCPRLRLCKSEIESIAMWLQRL